MNITTTTTSVTTDPQLPQQRGEPLTGQMVDHAVRYAGERHWDVFPGAWLEYEGGVPRCSCGEADCEAPGAHPVEEDWAAQATGSVTVVRRMWSEHPQASVLLPVGRTFDVIEVPETTGCLALARMERMEVQLGPVVSTPDGRMFFFVLPGVAAKVPGLVRQLGWSPDGLGMTPRGEGDWLAAPPSRLGTRGPVLWVREPTAANRWLPDAEEIVPPLAYACGRDAAAARER
ncbi:MAG TPA: bifunctional DNA primase/polymerase [Streptomyces sp.]|uniref:bifunctional DNA primase/polymerase n=1 Tax=Streptomyces sp. TaxID=1931 RepID=UPI002D6CA7A2|nr:bifunctional DNA primase/polymerase [Streptomyces sp.]HZG06990.1 bifunctional DNA primase/polymerase [Streptomyces sp.]